MILAKLKNHDEDVCMCECDLRIYSCADNI